MNREQTIRDTAYAIWEAEGRPAGRDHHHWLQAEKQVAAGAKPAAKKTAVTASKAKKPEAVVAAPKKPARGKKA